MTLFLENHLLLILKNHSVNPCGKAAIKATDNNNVMKVQYTKLITHFVVKSIRGVKANLFDRSTVYIDSIEDLARFYRMIF